MAYDTKTVADYYDGFATYQQKSGINDRHAMILHWLRRYGLRADHRVLEIGCGIGQVTQLLAEFCSRGHVEGVDISPQNIALAAERLKRFRHAGVRVSDMTDETFDAQFDWVVFPDVLEHIPAEQHPAVFASVSRVLASGGRIFVHIPHPAYQHYVMEHEPEKLQIIDQALGSGSLIRVAESAGLRLHSLTSYALFREPYDYQAVVFERDIPMPTPMLKPYWARVFQRLRLRGLRR